MLFITLYSNVYTFLPSQNVIKLVLKQIDGYRYEVNKNKEQKMFAIKWLKSFMKMIWHRIKCVRITLIFHSTVLSTLVLTHSRILPLHILPHFHFAFPCRLLTFTLPFFHDAEMPMPVTSSRKTSRVKTLQYFIWICVYRWHLTISKCVNCENVLIKTRKKE